MKVLKFGGTSVGSSDNIKKVAEIVNSRAAEGNIIVVVSAMGGVTNLLIDSAEKSAKGEDSYKSTLKTIEEKHFQVIRDLIPIKEQSGLIASVKVLLNQLEDLLMGVSLVKEISKKTSDQIVSFGEILSSTILSEVIDAKLVDSRSLIKTNGEFGNAQVNFDVTNGLVKDYFIANEANVHLLPGFISSTVKGDLSTLGRGGSDYTASIIAGALGAEVLEIWTDVNGIMTADPRKVEQAFTVPAVSYKEAMELSHFGAKVIYPPTILPVFKAGIPIRILNTFDTSAEGTLISGTDDSQMPIKGISSIEKIALLSMSGGGMVGIPGISSRLFGALSQAGVNVILITQASSEHSITLAVSPDAVETAEEFVNAEFELEIQLGKVNPLKVELGLSIVALVGEKMSGQVNVSGKMFNALGSNGINIRAIAQGSSERNISAVIEEKNVKKALNVLHERHFASDNFRLNLFMVGVGNVGGTLVNQIKEQMASLEENSKIEIRVIGMCNSRKYLVQESGIDLENWKEALDNSENVFSKEVFLDQITALNLRNSVLVDCTANEDVANMYKPALSANVSVVTANKIACSSGYDDYKELKAIALKNGAKFLFETNVGAGLPVIGTINDLVFSGDKIKEIQGVVSGSLNFIYNVYNGENKFHDVVKQAQQEGYTEPDPRIDLSGVDVKRKIVILVRESGYKMELEDVNVKSFLPDSCFEVDSVDDFFGELIKHEATFKKMVDDAKAKNEKLRIVGSFDGKTANVEMQSVGSDHPFFNLQGKDNIVVLHTSRYAEQPMVIQGAGAGAAVTAAGVFADIIRIAKT
jgi:aspartokinase/homoserine dehydrogenase 1